MYDFTATGAIPSSSLKASAYAPGGRTMTLDREESDQGHEGAPCDCKKKDAPCSCNDHPATGGILSRMTPRDIIIVFAVLGLSVIVTAWIVKRAL